MPTATLAAVLHAPGQPMTLQQVELADPGPGEALVSTRATGVCGTDVFFADGRYRFPVPTVLGHEAAGVVEAVGPGVTDVRPGDRVIICDQAFCGRCGPCLSGQMVYCTDPDRKTRQRQRLRIEGAPARQYLGVSSFAESMLVSTGTLIALPDELDFEAGALLSCCLTTGVAAVFNVARPQPGSAVAVIGCGGVGLAAVQAARIAGAAVIVAVDPKPHRRALAEQLGATSTVNPDDGEVAAVVADLTAGGAQHSIEAVGRPDTAALAVQLLAPGGCATLLGMQPDGADITIPAALLRHGRTIGGSVMGSVRTRHDIPRYARLALTGALYTAELITDRRKLTDINDAVNDTRDCSGIRTMITF